MIALLKIDDPVECISIHGLAGIWGMLATGLFGEEDVFNVDSNKLSKVKGLFKGGGPSLLGMQAVAIVCIIAWAVVTSIIEVSIFLQGTATIILLFT